MLWLLQGCLETGCLEIVQHVVEPTKGYPHNKLSGLKGSTRGTFHFDSAPGPPWPPPPLVNPIQGPPAVLCLLPSPPRSLVLTPLASQPRPLSGPQSHGMALLKLLLLLAAVGWAQARPARFVVEKSKLAVQSPPLGEFEVAIGDCEWGLQPGQGGEGRGLPGRGPSKGGAVSLPTRRPAYPAPPRPLSHHTTPLCHRPHPACRLCMQSACRCTAARWWGL